MKRCSRCWRDTYRAKSGVWLCLGCEVSPGLCTCRPAAEWSPEVRAQQADADAKAAEALPEAKQAQEDVVYREPSEELTGWLRRQLDRGARTVLCTSGDAEPWLEVESVKLGDPRRHFLMGAALSDCLGTVLRHRFNVEVSWLE